MNISEIKEKSINKIIRTASCIKDALPYTTINGKYNDESESRPSWWTNSFWAGILWQMYDVTGENIYADYAIGCEKKLENVLYKYEFNDHDLGFLWLLSGVEHFKHFEDKKAKDDALLSDSKLGFSYFYSHHMLNPQEDYYQPRLRNAAYESFYKYKEETL